MLEKVRHWAETDSDGELRMFYSRRCLPKLRNFGLKQGYLE